MQNKPRSYNNMCELVCRADYSTWIKKMNDKRLPPVSENLKSLK
ncbi:MAG: hypothetical protein OSJ27_08015 [Candidatus Gastranaerophilales bacterium]|nr:hypothetical protein [Candidatus Gastranaerophilales bacterium]